MFNGTTAVENGPLTMEEESLLKNPSTNDAASDEEESTSDDSDYDSDDDDSEYSTDSDTSGFDSGMEDLEAALRLGSRQKDMKRSLSSPAMAAIFNHVGPKNSQPKRMSQAETIAGLKDLAERMKKSESTAYLQKAIPEKVVETVEDPFAATDPDDFLQQLLEGISAKSFPSETWHDYFQTMTPEHVGAYTTEMVQAIRNDEYDYLRERLRNGHTLQCCNTHGESILHLVCRRGSEDMLRFLMEEAGVSVRIRDDKGRTPFHDGTFFCSCVDISWFCNFRVFGRET